MAKLKRMQFSTTIKAPVDVVWRTMLDADTYRQWTSAFMEGSYYEGSWDKGARIRFLSPGGEGMVAEIAEHRPREFISVRHLGSIANGVEDTTSAATREWAPAYENYTFEAVPGGTKLVVDQDVSEKYEQYMQEAWPKALQRLKDLAEG